MFRVTSSGTDAVRRRLALAAQVEARLARIGADPAAPVELEVEVDGPRRLRRMASLAAALEVVGSRPAFLHGGAGAGKSVAIRGVVAAMAGRVTERGRIPVHVDLTDFRPLHRPVDAAQVRGFVLACLDGVGADELDTGRWHFFFDSFDEIPDVAAATGADAHTNRASNVPVDVVHSAGTTTRRVDQRSAGGQWVSLGSYAFAAGTAGSVLLRTDGTDGYVVADAVRFVAS